MLMRILLLVFAVQAHDFLELVNANTCDPAAGCNVCDACCKSYLKDPKDCDQCVAAECKANICVPATCNVCQSCCKSYLTNQADCDACVRQECSGPAPSPTPPPATGAKLGAYFANWAQYHPAPYSHTADQLSGIVHRLDYIMYSFLYFCPPSGTSPKPYWAMPPYGSCQDSDEYQLMSVETKDSQFLPTITGFKSSNPKLKVLLSIGGWNFPSAYFSKMASTSQNRAKFIQSCISWMSRYNADGIDLDWEYPCSPPRSNPVKITCEQFRDVEDAGGNCPGDTANMALLAKEMRAAFGSKYIITVASQAAKKNEDAENIRGVTPYIDSWHIMSYDYSVSDLPQSDGMAINCPLYAPPSAPGVPVMNVNKTITDYKAAGVPQSKILVGIPYYGHTWFNPNLGSNWNKFGGKPMIQGTCCGPFKSTYGAQPGKGSGLCGTMMYSEIVAAKAQQNFYDETTQSDIAYWTSMGADGYTAAGTWLSYNSLRSIKAITNYAMQQGSGVFIFDTSMDSMSGGRPTWELTNGIADTLGGH